MNHRTKFDVASFILGGEICNRTNTHTKKQTATDISTLCLSACVDNQACNRVDSNFTSGGATMRINLILGETEGPDSGPPTL